LRSLLTVSEEWGETGQKFLVVAVIAARRPAVRTAASGIAAMRASSRISASSRSATIIAAGEPAARSAAVSSAARCAGSGPPGIRTATRSSTRVATVTATAWRTVVTGITVVVATAWRTLRGPSGIRPAARTLTRIAAIITRVRRSIIVRVVSARRYNRLLHVERGPVRSIGAGITARVVGTTAIRIARVLILPRRLRRL